MSRPSCVVRGRGAVGAPKCQGRRVRGRSRCVLGCAAWRRCARARAGLSPHRRAAARAGAALGLQGGLCWPDDSSDGGRATALRCNVVLLVASIILLDHCVADRSAGWSEAPGPSARRNGAADTSAHCTGTSCATSTRISASHLESVRQPPPLRREANPSFPPSQHMRHRPHGSQTDPTQIPHQLRHAPRSLD